jgi:hypothetical protein
MLQDPAAATRRVALESLKVGTASAPPARPRAGVQPAAAERCSSVPQFPPSPNSPLPCRLPRRRRCWSSSSSSSSSSCCRAAQRRRQQRLPIISWARRARSSWPRRCSGGSTTPRRTTASWRWRC